MSRRTTLLVDAVLAAGLAVVVLVLSPGVALAAVIALLVVVLCGVSFGVEAMVTRRRAAREDRVPVRARRGR